jgi:hypothetical protein
LLESVTNPFDIRGFERGLQEPEVPTGILSVTGQEFLDEPTTAYSSLGEPNGALSGIRRQRRLEANGIEVDKQAPGIHPRAQIVGGFDESRGKGGGEAISNPRFPILVGECPEGRRRLLQTRAYIGDSEQISEFTEPSWALFLGSPVLVIHNSVFVDRLGPLEERVKNVCSTNARCAVG